MPLNKIDHLITSFDTGLRILTGVTKHPSRPRPDNHIIETALSEKEKSKSGSLMRINHTGEICAQALYQGQLLFAKNTKTIDALTNAAKEETDHLIWCQERLEELDAHRSYLNPIWYTTSFLFGTMASLCDDPWSLGFLDETEKQVGEHLSGHLKKLPANDYKSQVIIEKMRDDELRHAETARNLGGREMPAPVKSMMRFAAHVMRTVAGLI